MSPVYAETDGCKSEQNRRQNLLTEEARQLRFLEISCPWVENRKQKEEKTTKYAPLRLELKRQHPGYEICQYNVIIDVLGGYSKETSDG